MIIDVRIDSPTFGEHLAVILSQENKSQLFVPRGFAHGFIVLSEEAIFSYKVDNVYNIESEIGIIYSDPNLRIDGFLNTVLLNCPIKILCYLSLTNQCFIQKLIILNKMKTILITGVQGL